MGETAFRVIFAARAWADLDELSAYWTQQGETWRGEKYHRDLIHRAEVELSDPVSARRGRRHRGTKNPHSREILAFGVYRIIYRIDEPAGIVNVLRFWPAHRDEPDRDA
jgi:mRNA-degrading endonuclease RelE of RelBE toxin-antitoxin system